MGQKNDVKIVEVECAKALAQIGIETKSGIGTMPINGDFLGWVGLNSGRHEGFIRINPFVGVHCPAIMKMAAMAEGKKYRPKEIATFAVFLGTLCPHVEQFIFTDETDVVMEAERLSSVVAEFGIPYMETIASYPALLPILEARVPNLGGYPQRYAAALYLNGDARRAEEFIDGEIVSLERGNEIEVIASLENLKQLMLSNYS